MASYPDSVRAFAPRVDKVDLNAAEDINDLQREVVALQETLGRNPHQTANYSAATVADRLALLEKDVLVRLREVEKRLRLAAVSATLTSSLQLNSSDAWQPLTLQVETLLNGFTGTTLYDQQGRFYSVAPSPSTWTLTATVTFLAPNPGVVPAGIRGLGVRTAGGHLLAATVLPPVSADQSLTVSWTGRLLSPTDDAPTVPVDHLELVVRHNQGTALFLATNAAATPTRASFTHIPG